MFWKCIFQKKAFLCQNHAKKYDTSRPERKLETKTLKRALQQTKDWQILEQTKIGIVHTKKNLFTKVQKQVGLSLGLNENCSNELPNMIGRNFGKKSQTCQIYFLKQKAFSGNDSNWPTQVGLSLGLNENCSNELQK